MFRFANTYMFYLLALIPVLVLLFIAMRARKKKLLERFGNPELLAGLAPEASRRRVRNKFILLLCALALLILAGARPQFGSKLKEVEREGIEMMLAVDVSNSMLAQDFEPNRLERTKYAILRMLEEVKGDHVGLVAFAGDAYVQLPVTSDYATARNFVANLSPNMVSRQGTAIGAAIDLASASFSPGSEGSRVLVVISDGENHEDDAIAAAQRAAQMGMRIFTIGIGTPEGAPIQVGDDFIKDEKGEIVVSKLDEATLQQIAMEGGGAYIRANNKSIGLEEIVQEINRTEKQRLKATVFEEYNEQYSYLLWAALALMVVEFLMLARKNKILARFNIFASK